MTDLIDREGMRRDVLAMEEQADQLAVISEPVRRVAMLWFAAQCHVFAAELEGRIHES